MTETWIPRDSLPSCARRSTFSVRFFHRGAAGLGGTWGVWRCSTCRRSTRALGSRYGLDRCLAVNQGHECEVSALRRVFCCRAGTIQNHLSIPVRGSKISLLRFFTPFFATRRLRPVRLVRARSIPTPRSGAPAKRQVGFLPARDSRGRRAKEGRRAEPKRDAPVAADRMSPDRPRAALRPESRPNFLQRARRRHRRRGPVLPPACGSTARFPSRFPTGSCFDRRGRARRPWVALPPFAEAIRFLQNAHFCGNIRQQKKTWHRPLSSGSCPPTLERADRDCDLLSSCSRYSAVTGSPLCGCALLRRRYGANAPPTRDASSTVSVACVGVASSRGQRQRLCPRPVLPLLLFTSLLPVCADNGHTPPQDPQTAHCSCARGCDKGASGLSRPSGPRARAACHSMSRCHHPG